MTSSEMPDAQECKQYATQLLGRAWATPYSDVEDRTHLIAEAQVWATLATVPEPLDLSARFPTLVCPHGMQAQLVPMDTEEIDGIDFPTGLRYTWQPDCAQGCP